MANVPMPDQGRSNSAGAAPIDLAWRYPDPNTNLTVYLLVAPPQRNTVFDPRGLHWSLSWEVRQNVWRHVNVLTHRQPNQPSPNPRYIYFGPLTKTGGDGTLQTVKIIVGNMSLAMRQRIEALAWSVPVMYPNGQWNCQDWLIDLLGRMRNEGLIDDQTLRTVIGAARDAWDSDKAK
ncbi:hypothetical protein BN946_scf184815.g39 [Trametes cinnabarina]|uniref:Uncharacterized protein n=1 Tax=Pycnoporus cinnabarinus TaxID=5643 RepID=A0A060S208_PYCCI|nr:hypothetical protein BN946_scf184815.g39 [Trametes cinnabarina]